MKSRKRAARRRLRGAVEAIRRDALEKGTDLALDGSTDPVWPVKRKKKKRGRGR